MVVYNTFFYSCLLAVGGMGEYVLSALVLLLLVLLAIALGLLWRCSMGKGKKKEILDSLAENVLVFDVKKNIVYTNQSARLNLFHGLQKQAKPLHCYQQLFNQSEVCNPCPVEKAIRLGVVQEADLHLNDGRVMHALARPLFNRSAEIDRVMVGVRDVTEERMVQQKKRDENALLAQVMDLAQCGVFDFYLAGRNVICSEIFIKLLGVRGVDQVLLETWLSLFEPEDRVRFLQAVEACSPTHAEFSLECRIKRDQGQVFWAQIRGRCVQFSSAGDPHRIIGAMQDVSTQKKKEMDLTERHKLLQALIDNMPIGLWAKDVRDECRYFLWNPPLYEFSGFSPDAAIGKTDKELFSEKRVALHRKTDFEIIQARKPLRPRVDEMVDVSGHRRYLQVTKAPILGADGQVSAILGIILDVTDRVRVVETLRESEARLKSFLDVTPIGIFQTTRRGDALLYANPAAAVMFGFESVEEFKAASRQKNVGKLLYAIPDVRERLVENFVQSGKSWDSFDVKFRRASGDIFDAHLYLCLRDEDLTGNQLFYSFVEDVSDQKQAETENAMLRHDLEHIARVNTLGQLAASIAHEINQPLAAIMSNAQAALRFIEQDKDNVDGLREILQDIANDDRRAGDVIARLRALLKRKAIELIPVNINSVIDGVCALVEQDFLHKGVAANIYKDVDIADVNGDRIQLQQVFLNLFTNGAEAMGENPPGTKVLTVRSRQVGHSIYVSVSDCGSGVDPALVDRIFDPFFTTKKHGLGMGLSINRTIINSLGGELLVEDNMNGRGACFTVILPVSGMGNVGDTIAPCS